MRSMQARSAARSPSSARAITALVSSPALSSNSCSAITVALLRDPRGRPAGLPLWPGRKGMSVSPRFDVGRQRAARREAGAITPSRRIPARHAIWSFNSEIDATVFAVGAEQSQLAPISCRCPCRPWAFDRDARRDQPSACAANRTRSMLFKKCRRSAIGNARQLQRKALSDREECPGARTMENNGRAIRRPHAKSRPCRHVPTSVWRRNAGVSLARNSLSTPLEMQSAPEAAAPDAQMSLCTYCHAPLASEAQAEFNLSPLFSVALIGVGRASNKTGRTSCRSCCGRLGPFILFLICS